MTIIRRSATYAAALLLAVAAVAAASTGASTAAAATTANTSTTMSTNTVGANTSNLTLATSSSTQSTGVVQWNTTTWALTITVNTGQLATGSCVTAYFDWRSNGHHDARGLRDCKSNDTYSYSFPDSNTSNLVAGFNRLGLCYGTADTTGTCTYGNALLRSTIPMDWTPWPQPTWANPCVLSWTRRNADGTTNTYIDAHSQRRTLQGSSC